MQMPVLKSEYSLVLIIPDVESNFEVMFVIYKVGEVIYIIQKYFLPDYPRHIEYTYQVIFNTNVYVKMI